MKVKYGKELCIGAKLITGKLVMPHFMYQLLWAMGYPDILKNITYGCVSVRMVPDLISLELVDCVEKTVARHSSTLAWKIPWMEEPGVCHLWGLTVRHD